MISFIWLGASVETCRSCSSGSTVGGAISEGAGIESGACGGAFASVFIVILLEWHCAKLLGGERPGGVEELHESAPVAGIEATALGRGEALLRELEVGENRERLTGPGEPRLEPRGQGAQRRGAAIGRPHETERCIEKLASFGRARGQPIGAD
jgi:hypothetical protein